MILETKLGTTQFKPRLLERATSWDKKQVSKCVAKTFSAKATYSTSPRLFGSLRPFAYTVLREVLLFAIFPYIRAFKHTASTFGVGVCLPPVAASSTRHQCMPGVASRGLHVEPRWQKEKIRYVQPTEKERVNSSLVY